MKKLDTFAMWFFKIPRIEAVGWDKNSFKPKRR